MAIIGVSRNEREFYISNHDPSKWVDPTAVNRKERSLEDAKQNGATVFEIGSVDADVYAMLTDVASTVEQNTNGVVIRRNLAGKTIAFVRWGLRGWSNFLDADGNEIKFETVKRFHGDKEYAIVSDESLNLLSEELLLELGQRIESRNTLTKTRAGN